MDFEYVGIPDLYSPLMYRDCLWTVQKYGDVTYSTES